MMQAYWDRFDIVDAHYWYCVNSHGGQGSREYQRLSRISQYYKPSPLANGPSSENAQAIYDALCKPWYPQEVKAFTYPEGPTDA